VRQQFANRDAAGRGLQRPFRYWASPQPRPEARPGRT
jgi:hypothetical protein